MFSKVLVANRGEIAVRVMQACAELGVRTVAVYSEADAGALHVRRADQAVCIGPPPAGESYLNIPAIIAAALQTRAEAVHPGYGFLSENAAFARACVDAGLVFIGPPAEAIRLMGSKIESKRLAAALGLPLVPGYDGARQDDETLQQEAQRIGFPVLIKASAGGGGRGMRVVRGPDAFGDSLAGARREARSAFGDDAMLLERYIDAPRHVELQVVADAHGGAIHLGERECSIQRRHQKVIEEAPSPAVTPEVREAMAAAALTLTRAIDYRGVGTVEFLLDADGRFAFLEMNTRLQVEHGVTELVTGVDLVHLQLRIAAGEPLPLTQPEVQVRGHAVECRLYAEDATRDFLPSTGTLTRFAPPDGPGIRNDVGVQAGDTVSPFYDAMLAKLLVVGSSREDAVRRSLWAVRAYDVGGVQTNLPLLEATLAHPQFAAGTISTAFLEQDILVGLGHADAPPPDVLAAAAVALASPQSADPWRSGWRATGSARPIRLLECGESGDIMLTRRDAATWTVADGGRTRDATRERDGVSLRDGVRALRYAVAQDGSRASVSHGGQVWQVVQAPPPDPSARVAARVGGAHTITAPLTGQVIAVHVREGEAVTARQPLIVLEAMKMEHTLAAPADGRVVRVLASAGDLVQTGSVLLELGDA